VPRQVIAEHRDGVWMDLHQPAAHIPCARRLPRARSTDPCVWW
jgi:hypothetical protein